MTCGLTPGEVSMIVAIAGRCHDMQWSTLWTPGEVSMTVAIAGRCHDMQWSTLWTRGEVSRAADWQEGRGTVTSSVPSVSVAGVDLPVADDMKVLGVVLDRRLTFHKHVLTVARSCN